jgi:hypothetical protein
MKEISCPRCGVVFAFQKGSRLCPHCGREASRNLAKVRDFFARHSWRILQIILIAGIVVINLGMHDWRVFAGASVILGGGLLWALFLSIGSGGVQDPIAALNLGERERRIPDEVELPVRPPVAPEQWQKLVSLTAPRDVFIGRSYKIYVFSNCLLMLMNAVLVVWSYRTRVARHGGMLPLAFIVLIYVILPIWFTIVSVRRERAAQDLLRDGEVTIGCWGEGSYQFWTRTGERFEHWGTNISDDSSIMTDSGLVPVFYLRDNPTKSVALCCIVSRVRIPLVESTPEAGKVAAEA